MTPDVVPPAPAERAHLVGLAGNENGAPTEEDPVKACTGGYLPGPGLLLFLLFPFLVFLGDRRERDRRLARDAAAFVLDLDLAALAGLIQDGPKLVEVLHLLAVRRGDDIVLLQTRLLGGIGL